MEERIHFTGIIRIRLLPQDWTEADWRYWWLGEFDDSGRMIRPPRMSEREKDRWTVHESRNLLCTAGRTALLNYVGSQTSTNQPFGKYFSLGTTSINTVNPGDTSVVGEIFRKLPATANVTGTQIDIATALANGDAVGTLTNAGLYGGASATGTLGTGTLYTHSLITPNFVKDNSHSYTSDYLLSLT